MAVILGEVVVTIQVGRTIAPYYVSQEEQTASHTASAVEDVGLALDGLSNQSIVYLVAVG